MSWLETVQFLSFRFVIIPLKSATLWLIIFVLVRRIKLLFSLRESTIFLKIKNIPLRETGPI